ncbi:hypothetical protein KAI54_00785 [Candidatus Gracilibacteria bacterium]|nr:hypothetical protein [Candidatus Gracilibacteria bacterium]
MSKFPRKTIYLVSPDPSKIEGLEFAWPHLKIFVNKLTPELRKAEKRGVEITNLKLPKVKKTSHLLGEMISRKLIRKGNRLLIFKNLPKIEKLAAKHHLEVLMSKAKFISQLEDKINFVDFCHDYALPILPTQIRKLNLVIFVEPIVVQMRRGHAGESTFFVRSNRELNELKRKAGEWVVKITPLKKLPTFSLNLCITRAGTFTTQPFFQITGDPNLNPLPGGTGGIDFGLAAKMLSEKSLERISALVELVGNALAKIGYRGIAGIDFLVDEKKHHIFLLELNPRLLSNLGFVTKKQAAIEEIPLLTIHLLEMLGEDLREWDLPRVSAVKEGRFESPHPDARMIF